MLSLAAILSNRALKTTVTPVYLYPPNELADEVHQLLREQKVESIITDAPSAEQRVIVVCADKEKVQRLRELAKYHWQGHYPQVILGGCQHSEVELWQDPVASQPLDSQAHGYPCAMQDLLQECERIRSLQKEGRVLELGTLKGGTLFLLQKELRNQHGIQFVGFDSWDGKRHRHSLLDLFDMPQFVACEVDYAVSKERLDAQTVLVKGDISETIRKYFDSPHHTGPILLAFIDTDNYSPAAVALPLIWSSLDEGGCVVFDHYNTYESWYNTIGEHIAAREFFDERTDYEHVQGSGLFRKKSSISDPLRQ